MHPVGADPNPVMGGLQRAYASVVLPQSLKAGGRQDTGIYRSGMIAVLPGVATR